MTANTTSAFVCKCFHMFSKIMVKRAVVNIAVCFQRSWIHNWSRECESYWGLALGSQGNIRFMITHAKAQSYGDLFYLKVKGFYGYFFLGLRSLPSWVQWDSSCWCSCVLTHLEVLQKPTETASLEIAPTWRT